MFPTFTNDLKVVDADGQGTQAEYVGKELKDIDLIKKFKSIHKRAYGLLTDKEGVKVSDILCTKELDFYKDFEWPESVSIDIDITIEFCELFRTLGIETPSDWITESLDDFGISIIKGSEVHANCRSCNEESDTCFGVDEIRAAIECVEAGENYCGRNPWCCP